MRYRTYSDAFAHLSTTQGGRGREARDKGLGELRLPPSRTRLKGIYAGSRSKCEICAYVFLAFFYSFVFLIPPLSRCLFGVSRVTISHLDFYYTLFFLPLCQAPFLLGAVCSCLPLHLAHPFRIRKRHFAPYSSTYFHGNRSEDFDGRRIRSKRWAKKKVEAMAGPISRAA